MQKAPIFERFCPANSPGNPAPSALCWRSCGGLFLLPALRSGSSPRDRFVCCAEARVAASA